LFYHKGKVYRKSSSTVQVGLSGTEQSTVDAEHLLTSNSASASLLIDAHHQLNEACTSLLDEVMESTVAQAIVDVDHALVQSCTSLFSKTQSVIEEFSVAADGADTEVSNSI